MKKIDLQKMCMDLLKADSEAEVVEILRNAELWDDRSAWRLYGDKEGNFAQAGNQQALPEAALVEKIVNSCDARLMSECLLQGIPPESDQAPQSVRDAVAMFFEGRRAQTDEAGTLANWSAAKRREESGHITIAATGSKPKGPGAKHMCLTIADEAEGQTPNRIPKTILSFNEKNKQRIRFVQGKFNMGGSGCLRFCGNMGLQLIISRRHPKLAQNSGGTDDSAGLWGFTVVRREEPSNKNGEPVHSEFTYLAPMGAEANPRKGEILRFSAEKLPLMPDQDKAYAREIGYGTAIKLYEYETGVRQSNVLMADGLLYALERLLPEIALPVRIHECRGYEGKKGSFDTPIAGLVVRLEEGKGDNLEAGFPDSAVLNVQGMRMNARIYAFKEGKGATYLKDEGVIFTINGQAHGYLPKSIFSRPKAVGLPRLKDSLLVLVDCSTLTAREREDLFMSSRDRLSKKPIRFAVEEEIEERLRTHPGLAKLQQQRREADVQNKLSDERPLEQVLGKVFSASPSLKSLFLKGQRLARPFATGAGGKAGEGKGPTSGDKPFEGRRHPTYFRFHGLPYGQVLVRNCEQGRRCRVKFDTDVENGYFERATDKGEFKLELVSSPRPVDVSTWSVHLDSGTAHLSVSLPDTLLVGDVIEIRATVSDPTLVAPFSNILKVVVTAHHEHKPSSGPRPPRPQGEGGGESPDDQGISLPRIISVRENDEHWVKYKFTNLTASHVISDPIPVDGIVRYEHIFYISIDNLYLKTEMKYRKQDARLLEAKFKYGNVLLGLAILHEDENAPKQTRQNEADDEDSEEPTKREPAADTIRRVSQAVAPVLLPIIDQLSGLDEELLEEISAKGEDA